MLYGEASDAHLDLSRAPYVLTGVHEIDPVSLARFSGAAPAVPAAPHPAQANDGTVT